MGRIREFIFGGPKHLGFWTLPVFLIVGLAGAVIAGSLTVVYYSQEVRQLTRETSQSREDLRAAVDDVQAAGAEALAAIENQVAAVEESLTRQLPLEDVTTLGVVVIRATLNVPAPLTDPPPPPAPDPTEPPASDEGALLNGAPIPAEAQPQTESQSEAPAESPSPFPSPTFTLPSQPSPTPSPEPPPPPPPRTPKLGLGFAVAVSDGSTYFATSYGLIADPLARAGVVEAVEIVTPQGIFAATVHDWDQGRDLAIVRSRFTGPAVGDWRPRDETIAVGERLYIVGITPNIVPLQLQVTTGYVTPTEILIDVGRKDQLRGAPIVDQTGRIAAIYTPDYQPFGAEAGEGQAVTPVSVLCERMLRGCEQLEAPPPPDDSE